MRKEIKTLKNITKVCLLLSLSCSFVQNIYAHSYEAEEAAERARVAAEEAKAASYEAEDAAEKAKRAAEEAEEAGQKAREAAAEKY